MSLSNAITADLATAFIWFTEVSTEEVTHPAKEEVSSSKPKDHSEEEPDIEGHGHQHQEVASADLDDMEDWLQNVHPDIHRVVLQTGNTLAIRMNQSRDGILSESLRTSYYC